MKILLMEDKCITCNEGLAPWERNRAECLDCRERSHESYGDDAYDCLDEGFIHN